MLEKFRSAALNTRIITAVILATVLITAWALGGWYVKALLGAIILLGLGEFLCMFQRHGAWGMKLTGLVLGAVYFCISVAFPDYPSHLIITLCFMVCAVYALVYWSKTQHIDSMRNAVIILAGLLYIPVLMTPLALVSRWEQLLIVAVPAASDISAYFSGVLFGKHKIWPSVSPKKSVEGAAAGLAAAMLVSLLIGMASPNTSALSFIVLGLVMGIMAQLGDFFESALKRAANIKDSSHLLPGHGGILDRLDSISFCSGVYAVLSVFIIF